MNEQLKEKDAKQGGGGMSLPVLVASMILAVVAAFAVYTYGERTDSVTQQDTAIQSGNS